MKSNSMLATEEKANVKFEAVVCPFMTGCLSIGMFTEESAEMFIVIIFPFLA